MREVLFKYEIRALIIYLTMAKCSESSVPRGALLPGRYEPREQSLPVLDGERIELDFPYSCNSTKVTLQRHNDVPFYNSGNPDAISSNSRNKIVMNYKKGDNCSLLLVIDPVSRNDEDSYILMTNDGMGKNIRLNVGYPPGKASCQLSSIHIHEEWVRLQCVAQAGSIAGQIICYQNGMHLYPLTQPRENLWGINQNILARSSDSVYCCSSLLEQTIDICTCKDWGWNFTNNRPLTDLHPCASASTTHSPTSSQSTRLDMSTSIPTSKRTTIPVSDLTIIPITKFTTELTQAPLVQETCDKWPQIIVSIFSVIFSVTIIISIVIILIYKNKIGKAIICSKTMVTKTNITAHYNKNHENVNFKNTAYQVISLSHNE